MNVRLVFFSPILNIHQVKIASELWALTNNSFYFVELQNLDGDHKKGDVNDYSSCPYILRAWESEENFAKALMLARTAECCVFSGIHSLYFEKERLKNNLLCFDMSERWLKKGLINLISPRIARMYLTYKLNNWQKKNIYKLCCSAFAASDQYQIGTFVGKCYKWGYFTDVQIQDPDVINHSGSETVSLMWCSRYLKLKHPELPIYLAHNLRDKGYRFHLDMYGEGEYKAQIIHLSEKLQLKDYVTFYDNMPNRNVIDEMKKHDIFLFTSDRNEGWGVVANESMSCGCALVASNEIGSVPYLIKDRITGVLFQGPSTRSSIGTLDMTSINSLTSNVIWLLENPTEHMMIRKNAIEHINNLWSSKVAALRLIDLIGALSSNKETPYIDGPCSKA